MVIFDQNNEQIILNDGRYYLRSDVGHFVPEYLNIEISKEDAAGYQICDKICSGLSK